MRPYSREIFDAASDPAGYTKVVTLIETYGVDPNIKHPENELPLVCFAADKGSLETTQYLIQKKQVNLEDNEGYGNLLYQAMHNSDPKVLDYVTSFVTHFKDGTTHAHVAAATGDLARLQTYAGDPSIFTVANNKEETPLYYAALAGSENCIRYLIQLESFQQDTDPNKYKLLCEGLDKRWEILTAKSEKAQTDAQNTKIVDLFLELSQLFNLLSDSDDKMCGMIDSYSSIGSIHAKNESKLGDAMLMYEHALQMTPQLFDPVRKYLSITSVRKRLAHVYFNLGLFEEGLSELEESVTIYNNELTRLIESNHLQSSDLNIDSGNEDNSENEDDPDSKLSEIQKAINLKDCITGLQQKILLVKNAKEYGYKCIDTSPDSDCFFTAVADLLPSQTEESLRTAVALHVEQHPTEYQDSIVGMLAPETNLKQYCRDIVKSGYAADHIAVLAISRVFKLTICIFDDKTICTVMKPSDSQGTICLGHLSEYYCALKRQDGWTPTKDLHDIIKNASVDSFVCESTKTKPEPNSLDEPSLKRQRKGKSIFQPVPTPANLDGNTTWELTSCFNHRSC